eukprot:Rmarinus@m.1292
MSSSSDSEDDVSPDGIISISPSEDANEDDISEIDEREVDGLLSVVRSDGISWGPTYSSEAKLLAFLQTHKDLSGVELLRALMECPSRRVLTEAMSKGDENGWLDGYLHSESGFMPPKPGASYAALRRTQGQIWILTAQRLPGLMQSYSVGKALQRMPLISGDRATIPTEALNAAAAVLGIMIQSFKYEWDAKQTNPDGYEIPKYPDSVIVPWRQISDRLRRPGCHLSYSDAVIENAYVVDHTRDDIWSLENIRLTFPAFGNQSEAVFLLVQTNMLGKFAPCVSAMVACQEALLQKDWDLATMKLALIKEVMDEMSSIFQQISVNVLSPSYVDPIVWGKTFAKWVSPWQPDAPSVSGLMSPLFHSMDSFLGRDVYTSVLGRECESCRRWFPPNWRDFINALALTPVAKYVMEATKEDGGRLAGVFRGVLEAYAGDRGLLGTHRYKVYAFFQLVLKTSRSSFSGGILTGSSGWEELHDMLRAARMERYDLASLTRGSSASEAEGKTDVDVVKLTDGEGPDEPTPPYTSEQGIMDLFGQSTSTSYVRDTYRECTYVATLKARELIADSGFSVTRRVVLNTARTGLKFRIADRVSILPLNLPSVVADTLRVMGLGSEEEVVLTRVWSEFFLHVVKCYMLSGWSKYSTLLERKELSFADRAAVVLEKLDEEARRRTHSRALTSFSRLAAVARCKFARADAQLILAFARLRPLFLDDVGRIHSSVLETVPQASDITAAILRQDLWPCRLSLPVVCKLLSTERQANTRAVFSPDRLASILSPLSTRTYTVCAAPDAGLPSELHLTVTRLEYPPGTDIPRCLEREERQKFLVDSSGLPGIAEDGNDENDSVSGPSDDVILSAIHAAASKMNRTEYGVGSAFLNPPDADEGTMDPIYRHVLLSVTSPLSFDLNRPTNHEPVVMFASGSGVSPFQAYLKHRNPSQAALCTEFWLLYEVRNREAFLYEKELLGLAKRGDLELRVAFTLEDVRLDIPDHEPFSGYSPAIAEGSRSHVGSLMLEPETAKRLWTLMRSRKAGGEGASFYVCGSTRMFRAVLEGFKQIISQFGGDESYMLQQLLAQKRIMCEVYSSPRSIGGDDPFFRVSEAVIHNNKENGYWVIVADKVYDLTDYMMLHPGGSRILRENSGRDATPMFNQVAHASNPAVMTLMNMYYRGQIRPLMLAAEQRHRYSVWLSYLFAVVEIENILASEFESHGLGDSSGGQPTFGRGMVVSFGVMQSYLDTHKRVLNSVLKGLFGAEFKMLFSLSATPLVVKGIPVTTQVIEEVEMIWRSQAAMRARRMAETMQELLQEQQKTSFMFGDKQFSQMIRFTEHVARADLAFSRNYKMAVREVILIYEMQDGDSDAIMSVFSKFVFCLKQLFTTLAEFSGFRSSRWNLVQRQRLDGTLFRQTKQSGKQTKKITVADLIGNAVKFARDMQNAKNNVKTDKRTYTESHVHMGAFARFADTRHTDIDYENQIKNAAFIMKALPSSTEVTADTMVARRWMVRTDLQQLFNKLDADGSGGIDREEIDDMLEKHQDPESLGPNGYEIRAALLYLKENFERLDADKNGCIEFDEFFEVWNEFRQREDRALLIVQRAVKRFVKKLRSRDRKVEMDSLVKEAQHERAKAQESLRRTNTES